MNKSLLFASFAALLVCSCTKSDKTIQFVDETNVPTKDVALQRLELDEMPLAPEALCFVDSFFVVCESDYGRKTDLISVYSNNKLIKKFGALGNGPTDMLLPMYFSDGRNEHKYLHVGSTDKYKRFDIENLIYNYKLTCETEDMPEGLELCNKMLIYNDSLVVAFCTGEYQLSFCDKKTGTTKGYANFDKSLLGNRVVDQIYNMQVCPATYASNGDVIIIAYNMQKGIDIVSNDGVLKKRLRFADYDANINKMKLDDSGGLTNVSYEDDATYFFVSACSTDEAFYLMCLDGPASVEAKSKVYQFDWDGNLQQIYQLDRAAGTPVVHNGVIYVISFAVDNEDADYEICYAPL